MAFEPYLQTRKRGCYRAPLIYKQPDPTPECNPDLYTWYFRQRWTALAQGQGSCNRRKFMDPTRCLLDQKLDEICPAPPYDKRISQYFRDYQYPWSHNNIDDCCKAACPCDGNQKEPTICYECKEREPLPPFDDRTTHKEYFDEKPVPPRPQRRIEPWDPCCCPLEGATSYRLDYPHKKTVPNGPVLAQITKGGMWSMDQFSDKPFPEDTEHLSQYTEKCDTKRNPIRIPNNLGVGKGPVESGTETCYEFGEKRANYPQIPGWLMNDTWVKPDTPLESCTTYKHFYRRHPLPYMSEDTKITSPGAIPFPTLNNVWYTYCDPVVDQRTPVELKDDDPWPYVKPCPIRYQDNLETDPCAPFRDETTHKADYYAKARCGRPQNFAPTKGFTPPILTFNDDTTNRVSFRAYTRDEQKGSKINPGNPNGKKWGPFQCPPNVDKCLPQFPAPYGHPLKPYTKQCPCGPFDDRSTYHQDFKFRSKEMVDLLNEEMCQQPNVGKGVSLYRHDYVGQQGQRAAKMPPPKGKGYRCVHPASFRDTDTLYRLQFLDFWKMGDRSKLELYRGHRTDENRPRKPEPEMNDEYEIIAMPEGTTVQGAIRACSK